MIAKLLTNIAAALSTSITNTAAVLTVFMFMGVDVDVVMDSISDEPPGQSNPRMSGYLAHPNKEKPEKGARSELFEPVGPPSPTTGIAVDKLPRIGSASPSAPLEPAVPRFSPDLKTPQADFFCSDSRVIGPSPVIEGWIYAGWHGDNERWRDKRLDFRRNLSPRALEESMITSSRGSNLRLGPPDWRGKLRKKIGYVDSIMKLRVKEVCPWRRRDWHGAYIWLRVEAIEGSRAARSN